MLEYEKWKATFGSPCRTTVQRKKLYVNDSISKVRAKKLLEKKIKSEEKTEQNPEKPILILTT